MEGESLISDSDSQFSSKTDGIYSLVNLSGGGYLIDRMRMSLMNFDLSYIDESIQQLIPPYLYNNGAGCDIPKSKLIFARLKDKGSKDERTKEMLKTSVSRPKVQQMFCASEPETLLSRRSNPHHNPYIGTRLCCWRIDKRGTAGETLLHLCLLAADNVSLQLARRLLARFPLLAIDIYLGDEYYGQSPLQMALVNEDFKFTRLLLDLKNEDGCPLLNVNERCNGKFFVPLDQKDSFLVDPQRSEIPIVLKKDTNYVGTSYWGEYPLSFAACFGSEIHYRWLLRKGADPLNQDFNGNNVLHMLVIHDNHKMFEKILELSEKSVIEKLISQRNLQGHNPFTLSALLARRKLFEIIINYTSRTLWVHGNVRAGLYPLSQLDSVNPDGSINVNSALDYIAMSNSKTHLDMIRGVVKEILDLKWKTYGRRQFFYRFVFYFIFVTNCSIAYFLRPSIRPSSYPNNCYLKYGTSSLHFVRYSIELALVTQWIIKLGLETREIISQGCLYKKSLALSPTKFLFTIAIYILFPGIVIFRYTCHHVAENFLCVISTIFITPNMLFFLRGSSYTGPFIVILFKMINKDLRLFVVIYFIVLTAFAQAFAILLRTSPDDIHSFETVFSSFFVLFHITVSKYDDIFETFKKTQHPTVIILLLLLFVTVSCFLLINLLIAMLAHSFLNLEENQKEWCHQRYKMMLLIERSMTRWQRKEGINQYSRVLDAKTKERGLYFASPVNMPEG